MIKLFKLLGYYQCRRKFIMKIDTASSPRLPVDRLKRPLIKPVPRPLAAAEKEFENDVEAAEKSVFSESFERELLQNGAKQFEKWLEKIEIK